MPKGIRITIFGLYFAAALIVPLYLSLFPGQPPLTLKQEVVVVEQGRLPAEQVVLGMGADNYQRTVLHDLDRHIDSVAADYPDGSNVVVAAFDGELFASQAVDELIELIPHSSKKTDMWSTRITSEGGEFVILTRIGEILIMVIADREELAQKRLEGLPLIEMVDEPGLGAVLARQTWGDLLLIIFGYILFQTITVSRLASWAAVRPAAFGARRLEHKRLHKSLMKLGENGPFDVRNNDGDMVIGWRHDDDWRDYMRRTGGWRDTRVHLRFVDKKNTVVLVMESSETSIDSEGVVNHERWLVRRSLPMGSFKHTVQVRVGEKDVALEPLTDLDYSDDQFYAVLAAMVTQAGWRFRPAPSHSAFLSG